MGEPMLKVYDWSYLATLTRVFTWECVARAAGYGSPKTAREYARRLVDPLRVFETCGRIWAWKERAALWRNRQESFCSQPRIEGTAALLAFVDLRDDAALMKLVRRERDPFPAFYDGRRLVAWQSAAEDWIEANTRIHVPGLNLVDLDEQTSQASSTAA